MLLACIETLAVSYMYKECSINVCVNVYCFYRLFTYYSYDVCCLHCCSCNAEQFGINCCSDVINSDLKVKTVPFNILVILSEC